MLEMRRKVCFVGDEGVGKTCLIRRLAHNVFDEAYIRTVGTTVSKIQVQLPETDRTVILMIWDIMGQRNFIDLFKEAYFNHVKGIVAVFDLHRQETLRSLGDWIGCVRSSVGDVPTIVLANKADLHPDGQVGDEEVHGFCDSHGITFMKTSAKTGKNVGKAVLHLAMEMAARELREEDMSPRESSRLATSPQPGGGMA